MSIRRTIRKRLIRTAARTFADAVHLTIRQKGEAIIQKTWALKGLIDVPAFAKAVGLACEEGDGMWRLTRRA